MTPTAWHRVMRQGDVPARLVAVLILTLASLAVFTGPVAGQEAEGPVLDDLSPSAGPPSGGTTVEVNGSGFVARETSVDIGQKEGLDVEVGEAGRALFFDTPGGPAGEVEVTVTTDAGTSGSATFTYQDNGPTIFSIDPDTGPADGGNEVALDGEGFIDGESSVTVDEATIDPDDVEVGDDGTRLVYDAPAHDPGAVEVTVTNPMDPNGPSGTSNGVIYDYAGTGDEAPGISVLEPASGPCSGGTEVVTFGERFVPGATEVFVGDERALDVAVSDDDSLQFRTPAGRPGGTEVTVVTEAGASEPVPFTYTGCDDTEPPVADGIDPARGPTEGGTQVEITGENFVVGDTTVFVGDLLGDDVAVDAGGARLTYRSPSRSAGEASVTVSTSAGATDPLTYEYLAAEDQEPAIFDLDPTTGPCGGGTEVSVAGENFVAGETGVSVGGARADDVVVEDDGFLRFTTPPGEPDDPFVIVETGAGRSERVTFTYIGCGGGTQAPVADDITPARGPSSGGNEVTITGENFVPGDTEVVVGGGDLEAEDVSVDAGGERLTFRAPRFRAGDRSVTVVTPAGSTDPLTYTYERVREQAPEVFELDPATGPCRGGTEVTVTGENLVPDATEVFVGGDAASDVVVGPGPNLTPDDPGEIGQTDGEGSLRFTTPAGEPGEAEVSVRTEVGEAEPLTFTYSDCDEAGRPSVNGINVDLGPAGGGTRVELSGDGFVPGETTVTIGTETLPAEEVSVGDDGTTLTFRTPGGPPGESEISVTTPAGSSGEREFTYIPTTDTTDENETTADPNDPSGRDDGGEDSGTDTEDPGADTEDPNEYTSTVDRFEATDTGSRYPSTSPTRSPYRNSSERSERYDRSADDDLAYTGSAMLPAVVAGCALAALGAGLIVAARRRRSRMAPRP